MKKIIAFVLPLIIIVSIVIITFGVFQVRSEEEKLMEIALEAGAEDIRDAEDFFEVLTTPAHWEKVKTACETKGIKPTEASIQMLPQNTIHLEGIEAEKMLKLMEALEDHDDVQNVHANFDIDASVMEKLAS